MVYNASLYVTIGDKISPFHYFHFTGNLTMNRVKLIILYSTVFSISACSSLLYNKNNQQQETAIEDMSFPTEPNDLQTLDKAGHKKTQQPSTQPTPIPIQNLGKAYVAVQTPQFTPKQPEYFLQIGQRIAPGSLAEAIQTIGALKVLSKDWKLSPKGQAEAIAENDATQMQKNADIEDDTAQQEPITIESDLEKMGLEIDIFQRLDLNVFLQTEYTYLLVLKVLRLYPTPPEQWQAFQNQIRKKIDRLVAIGNGDPSIDLDTAAPITIEEIENSEQIESTEANQEISAASIRDGDAILVEADQLAAKNQFKKAIENASKIKENSPFYPAAQEQIKAYSNLAVQKLRQKAATAFQSAIPVSDNETKISYLKQAQGFLKEALVNFPQADQLETVEQNLSVIERDLENLAERDEDSEISYDQTER